MVNPAPTTGPLPLQYSAGCQYVRLLHTKRIYRLVSVEPNYTIAGPMVISDGVSGPVMLLHQTGNPHEFLSEKQLFDLYPSEIPGVLTDKRPREPAAAPASAYQRPVAVTPPAAPKNPSTGGSGTLADLLKIVGGFEGMNLNLDTLKGSDAALHEVLSELDLNRNLPPAPPDPSHPLKGTW